MRLQLTNPLFLILLPLGLAWVIYFAWKSDVQISRWRRWCSTVLRVLIVSFLALALGGLEILNPQEGMNAYFLLDRSESIPSGQQEMARDWVNRVSAQKQKNDKSGVLVFGTQASIESAPNSSLNLQKVLAVVPTGRTDISAAIRLATAGFPENGQKRIVLISDGNENIGDAAAAVTAARPLGVTMDVLPVGVDRGTDVSIQKVTTPGRVKKGQTFEVKIFVEADRAQKATLRLYRNNQPLGQQEVELAAGKNLFSFPQQLDNPDFYSYNVQLEAAGDMLPQNNKASSYTTVRGIPRILVISSQAADDENLVRALRSGKFDVRQAGLDFPSTLPEIQSYDAIFLSNVSAGDLGDQMMKLLESAVRDFGIGLVCIGGDQAFAAGSYRNTPLESLLPVDMELNSKKVMPSGAVALVMHGMEFMNGNQVARDCAIGVLDALGPQDQIGVLLWDGSSKWLFPMTKASDKKLLGRMINGMNQGDMMYFDPVIKMAHEGLKSTTANLRHIIVFSDGDPAPPYNSTMNDLAGDRITVSTVLIAGHAGPETMIKMADLGRGRFYDVRSPADLPRIFIKETAVVLKSAIYEEPFMPQFVASSEIVRGIGGRDYPQLQGYVCTTAKGRAEVPLLTDKGDPLLAHWQYGLGRAVAFTSDAKPKWAAQWMGWEKYQQFWSQVAQWSLRKIDTADFASEVSVDRGEGHIAVDAVNPDGSFRNFLNLQTLVVTPGGERQTIRLEQTGPGHYEAKFPTAEVGAYMLNLVDLEGGNVRASQALGASVNYSPEFQAREPNSHLLKKLAELGGGKILDHQVDNPFDLDRKRTYQPRPVWEWLIQIAILLFPLDVAVRRIQLDREEWLKATASLRRLLHLGKPVVPPSSQEESLAALLSRRDEVRSQRSKAVEAIPDLFKPEKQPVTPQISTTSSRPAGTIKPAAEEPDKKEDPGPEKINTTSRLLDAKRRAKKKMDE